MPTRRGLTFLEVIMAAALLALATSMIFGGISFMESTAVRDDRRAAAMEVAHRVVLAYLNDKEDMKRQQGRYTYANVGYVFEWKEEVLERGEGGSTGLTRRRSTLATEVDAEAALSAQLYQFTVWVALEDPSAPGVPIGPPLAEIVRVYNPIAQFNDDRLLEWVLEVIQQGNARR